jgi:hypothetical protein
MRRSWCLPVVWSVLVAAAPVLAVAETSDEDLRTNRILLARWRSDPEHYARLKHDYKAFLELPPETRDRLRELDRDLRDEDTNTQARLKRVLQRYMAWLDRLPEEDRARVDAATDGNDRLRVVKDLREREWIAHLPRAEQERIHNTPADQRPKLIADLRLEETNRHREWQLALVHGDDAESRTNKPAWLNEFPAETRLYVSKTLLPMVRFEEKKRVREALGKWPDYARTVYELSQEHKTVKIPPGNWQGPSNPNDIKQDDVPAEIRNLLFMDFKKPKERDIDKADLKYIRRLRESNGKWPDFALAVNEVAKDKKATLKKPLGPCKLEDLDKAVSQFYVDIMSKKLSKDEIDKLEKARGVWPDYPMMFMELAQKHGLKVPGTYLGGSDDLWKSALAD